MQLEIAEKKENKALQRQEVLLKMKDAKVTPSRKELKPKIAAMLNAKENLAVIGKVSHAFGAREASISVSVYENEEALKKFELKHLVNRDLGKKEEKPAPKPEGKEEAKEEKPAEGKKEEKEKPAEKKEEKPEEKPAGEKKE